MAQRKARKKSDKQQLGDHERTDALSDRFISILATVTDEDLPQTLDPEYRILLLDYECALDDGPVFDGEIIGMLHFTALMGFFRRHVEVLKSRLAQIEAESELSRNLKNRLASRQYRQWVARTEPYFVCLDAALKKLVRHAPTLAGYITELRTRLKWGPHLSSIRPMTVHDGETALATVEELVEAHPDAGPWFGYFEPVKDNEGKIVHRRWRWGKLSSPHVRINSDGIVEPTQKSGESANAASLIATIDRLKPIEKSILRALFERGVYGEQPPFRPTQDVIAEWIGRSCDTTIKTALSSLWKAGLVDNWRHSGARGGYYLTLDGEAVCRHAFGHD